MKRDNERLAGLLEWSNALGDAEHVSDVLASATARASEMEERRRGLCVPQGRRRRRCPRSRRARAPTRSGSTPRTRARSRSSCAARWSRAGPRCASSSAGDMAAARGAAARELGGAGRDRGAAPRLRAVRRGRARRALDAREHVGGGAPQRRPARVAAQLLLARHRHARARRSTPTSASTAATASASRSSRTGSGGALGLGDQELSRLHFAALLHDIGMLKIDASQQMTRATCEKHCVFGHRMLSRIRLWRDLAPIVYHHHEWFDGRGYPDGLAGSDDPARVAHHRALRRGRQHDLRRQLPDAARARRRARRARALLGQPVRPGARRRVRRARARRHDRDRPAASGRRPRSAARLRGRIFRKNR